LGGLDDADRRSPWKRILAVAVLSLPLSLVAFGPLFIVGVVLVVVAGIKRIKATSGSGRRGWTCNGTGTHD